MLSMRLPSQLRQQHWLAALLAAVVLPQLMVLPRGSALLLALAALTRLWPASWPPLAAQLTRLGLLAAAWLLFRLVSGQVFSGELTRLLLLMVVLLKWAEARSPRDHSWVLAGAAVAAALAALDRQNLAGLLLLIGCAWLLAVIAAQYSGAARPAQTASRQLLWALPPTVLLFALFPRLPGPLWDVGLTLGSPLPLQIDSPGQAPGADGQLQLAHGSRNGVAPPRGSEGATVLAAHFNGYVPAMSELYWRGPVFWDFDGQSWRLEAGWNDRGKLTREAYGNTADLRKIIGGGRQVDYDVKIAAHGGRWLYGLEAPFSRPEEALVSRDFQLLSVRPLRRQERYHASARLGATLNGGLNASQRQRALALPPAANPRLLALGRRLAANHPDPARRLAALQALWTQHAPRPDPHAVPQAAADAYDRFWFDARAGDAPLQAGAFTLLARAADIPARLITGYRGGRLMALTDYVIVKQGHAHAWVETWLAGQGWRRSDPVDLALAGLAKPPAQNASQPQDSDSAAAVKPSLDRLSGRNNATPAADTDNTLSRWLDRWVIHLDSRQQQTLIASNESDGGLTGLLLWLAAAGLLLPPAYWAVLRWQAWRRLSPAQRAWRIFQRKLARRGYRQQASECPQRFAERVAAAHPEWAAALHAVTLAYLACRYGPADATALDELQRKVRNA